MLFNIIGMVRFFYLIKNLIFFGGFWIGIDFLIIFLIEIEVIDGIKDWLVIGEWLSIGIVIGKL